MIASYSLHDAHTHTHTHEKWQINFNAKYMCAREREEREHDVVIIKSNVMMTVYDLKDYYYYFCIYIFINVGDYYVIKN